MVSLASWSHYPSVGSTIVSCSIGICRLLGAPSLRREVPIRVPFATRLPAHYSAGPDDLCTVGSLKQRRLLVRITGTRGPDDDSLWSLRSLNPAVSKQLTTSFTRTATLRPRSTATGTNRSVGHCRCVLRTSPGLQTSAPSTRCCCIIDFTF